MTKQPLLSVIIPVYNTAPYLRQCLDSVLSQRVDDMEVICVDNNSTDNSPQILQDFSHDHTNVKIFTESKQGPSPSRKHGLREASGKYIFYLDGDDYFLDNSSLTNILQLCISQRADICAFNALVNETSRYLTPFPTITDAVTGASLMQAFYAVSRTMPTPIWMYLYRRETILSYDYFDNKGLYHQDEFYTPSMLYDSRRACCVDIPIVNYRWHRKGAITEKYTPVHYSDRATVARELYNRFTTLHVTEDEPYRQVLDVYLSLAHELSRLHIPLQQYLTANDFDIMRRCIRTAYERKCYRLAHRCPRLLTPYMENTLPPLLRKTINRWL